jgi:hypothetical protein
MAWLNIQHNTLPFEIAKSMLQAGVVSVAVAALTLLTQQHQRRHTVVEKELDEEQRRAEIRTDLLRSAHAQVTEQYNAVKRARRLLRARRLPGDIHSAEHYDEHLAAIVDAQLAFEALIADVNSSAGSVFSDGPALVAELKKVEKYLGDLISEYEEKRSQFLGTPEQLVETDLPVLREFLAKRKRGSGFDKAIEAFGKARDLIREDIAALAG